MRRPGPITTIALAAVISASCGGSSPTSPTGEASGADDGTTAATAPAGGGTINYPTIGDAAYNTGSAHVEVSGAKQLAFDAQLLPGVSSTNGGVTLLMYPSGESQNGALLSIANGPETGLAMTLTAPEVTTGGDGATGCLIELTQNDASGLAGRFDCPGITSISIDMPTVNVRGTFSAAP